MITISVDRLWALTKWLMVIAVAYFVMQYFRKPLYDSSFIPGYTVLNTFNYDKVNPNYAMNIISRNANPLQVDSIVVKSDGTPEYFQVSGEWYIKTRTANGSFLMIRAADIVNIYFVKKGEKPN